LHLLVVGKMQEVIRDHDLIIKAIAKSKADDAQFRIHDHLSPSLAYSPSCARSTPPISPIDDAEALGLASGPAGAGAMVALRVELLPNDRAVGHCQYPIR
jgi:hypothetical protein